MVSSLLENLIHLTSTKHGFHMKLLMKSINYKKLVNIFSTGGAVLGIEEPCFSLNLLKWL